MRYLPLLLVCVALLGTVVLLAGDAARAKRTLRNIVAALVVLMVLAALFALVAQRLIPR